MSEKNNLNDINNQDIPKCVVTNRTATAICDSALSSNSLPWSISSSISSSNSPPSSVSPTPSPPENMPCSGSSPPSVSSDSSTSLDSLPLSSLVKQNSSLPSNFSELSDSRSTATERNPTHPLDLHFRGLEPQASGSNSTVSLGSSNSDFGRQTLSSNKAFSPLLTSGPQNSEEFLCSSNVSSTSNCQTNAELHLLQHSNSSHEESYTLEGSYTPRSLLNLNPSTTEGSCTSFANQRTGEESCQELLKSSPCEPQPVENCDLNSNTCWSDLDPLSEVRYTLENLIDMFSECTICSTQESNHPETESTSDDDSVKEPAPKVSRLDRDPSAQFWIRTLPESLLPHDYLEAKRNASLRKSRQSAGESTSRTTEKAERTGTENPDYQIVDYSNRTQNKHFNDMEFKKLEKSLKDARNDIITFARFILKEIGKHPHMDLERLYDFKYCYTTFVAEEYKILEEKLSVYKEADEHEMLKQKIARLNFLEDENHKFLARLQYAIFMLKLHLKFNDEVKEIVMNIREMEKYIYTAKGWDESNETESSN